jgi:hypothetical protein
MVSAAAFAASPEGQKAIGKAGRRAQDQAVPAVAVVAVVGLLAYAFRGKLLGALLPVGLGDIKDAAGDVAGAVTWGAGAVGDVGGDVLAGAYTGGKFAAGAIQDVGGDAVGLVGDFFGGMFGSDPAEIPVDVGGSGFRSVQDYQESAEGQLFFFSTPQPTAAEKVGSTIADWGGALYDAPGDVLGAVYDAPGDVLSGAKSLWGKVF